MVRREITYKTENRNTIIYVLLHKGPFKKYVTGLGGEGSQAK